MVTVVVTVRNEAENIHLLLEALETQTHLPSKVIIVDAGSSDNTVNIVQQFKAKTRLSIDIIECIGNRSEGRNVGISAAITKIIAITDAGCIPKKDWLEKLVSPFEQENIIMVAGGYDTYSVSATGKIMASYMGKEFTPQQTNYLPSSRSIAFTKTAWKQVGGYPESLDYCEDLVFATNLSKVGKVSYAPSAQVTWQVHDDYRTFFDKLRHYAQGDIVAGFQAHVLKILSIFLRWILLILIPVLIPIYLIGISIVKQRNNLSLSTLLITAKVQLIADLAVIIGATHGLWIKVMHSIGYS